MKKKYILNVIDDVFAQETIAGLLGHRYEVCCVKDGLECLKSVINRIPDLIILDADVPVASGFHACKALKLNEDTRHIPVILLATDAFRYYSGSNIDTCADGYINKPLLPDEMVSKVDELLQ